MQVIDHLDELRTVIRSAVDRFDKIGLLTHKNPDGDGLSTCLALQNILEAAGKEVSIILEDEGLDSLDFLRVKERTIIYRQELSFPLILIVDCQSRQRLGKCGSLLDKAELIIAVDHHQDNGADDVHYLYNDTRTVSAGAIIYQALKDEFNALPPLMREESATALYVTVINDTNNFTNSNTNEDVFLFCAELSRLGIKPFEITRTFLLEKPASYFRFIGQALATITTHLDGQVLFFHSTIEMLEENHLHSDATSKVTNWVKKPTGVKIVVYFREIGTEKYRLSLRSDVIDVNQIARKYGGGGHRNASGCEVTGSLADVKTIILQDIKKDLPY